MSIERLVGARGAFHVNSSDGAETGNWFGFVVQEDTVITTLTLNGTPEGYSSSNYLTQANLNGKTLKAGAFISAPKNSAIIAITLSSGSVICYNLV